MPATLVSTQVIYFFHLWWNTMTYISYFNSSTGLPFTDSYYIIDKLNITYTWNYDLNIYTSECPNLNQKLLKCDCNCDEKIIGIQTGTRDCNCVTLRNSSCIIDFSCLENSVFFNTSRNLETKYLFSNSLNTNFTCTRPNFQFMSTCHLKFLTGPLDYNSTNNNSSISYYMKYAEPVSYSVLGNIQNVTHTLSDGTNVISQICQIPSSIQNNITDLIAHRDSYYSQIEYVCLSSICPNPPMVVCMNVVYSGLSYQNEIIWGSLAKFTCNSICNIKELTLKCLYNGTWNYTITSDVCNQVTTISYPIGSWSNWTFLNCSLAYRISGLTIYNYACLKLDFNISYLIKISTEYERKERIVKIQNSVVKNLEKIKQEYKVKTAIGYFGGSILGIVIFICIFLILFLDLGVLINFWHGKSSSIKISSDRKIQKNKLRKLFKKRKKLILNKTLKKHIEHVQDVP